MYKKILALKLSVPIVLSALLVPSLSLARNVQDFDDLIDLLQDFVNPVAGLITGLAFIFFLWGVTKYIASAGDESKKQEGRNIMLWGIIGLFVIFGIWGILSILFNTFFEGTDLLPVGGPGTQ